jgi:antitoxin ParD1/3/4
MRICGRFCLRRGIGWRRFGKGFEAAGLAQKSFDSGATWYYQGAMTVKSSISLADEQHAFAKTLVDAGRFPSMSAVLQQGVELLRQQLETESMERAALAEVLQQRRAGKFVSASVMDERIAAMLARKRQAHAAQD